MAAENTVDTDTGIITQPGFNEAAAHGRGKPMVGPTDGPTTGRFNEAAAHGRGKPEPEPNPEPNPNPLQ